jgi:protein ImuB
VTDAASGTGRRYLALVLPFLPTERLRRQAGLPPSAAPDEAPLVLVERHRGALRLAAVDPRALALGLGPGLTLADARARVPALAVADADPEADAVFLERLAEAADRYTPLVALDRPHGLVLDISGCAHLFGGEQGLHDDLAARLKAIGLTARSAIAGTPDAARALARFGAPAIVPPGAEETAVRPLPVAALECAPETVLALSRAGLKTIGALLDRPSVLLSSRFGEALAAKLRRLAGREDLRLSPRRPAPACLVERRFAEPVAREADFLAALRLLAGRAGLILEQRGEGGRRFEAAFFRTDGAVRRIAVETGRPVRDVDVLMRLYRERLAALDDPLDPGFGFDLVRFSVIATAPFDQRQESFDTSRADEEATAALIDRLVARFGRERVLQFAARSSHIPERAGLVVPALAGIAGANLAMAEAWPLPDPEEPPARPLGLFDPPQPVETLAEVPDGPPVRFRWRRVLHEVAHAEGPERIAAEWWRQAGGAPTRDYYRVEDSQGRRFWLFREGLYDREAGEPRWFLHGLFA